MSGLSASLELKWTGDGAMGRVEEALVIQRELTKLMPDDNYVREEIAECLKQLAQAQPRDERE